MVVYVVCSYRVGDRRRRRPIATGGLPTSALSIRSNGSRTAIRLGGASVGPSGIRVGEPRDAHTNTRDRGSALSERPLRLRSPHSVIVTADRHIAHPGWAPAGRRR